jgi:hypothetical protein
VTEFGPGQPGRIHQRVSNATEWFERKRKMSTFFTISIALATVSTVE